MNPNSPAPSPKPPKDANPSQYYKVQHSEKVVPEPIVIKPANKKYLKYAGICVAVAFVSAIIAVVTNIAGFVFELISTVALIAAFVFFVRWALKTIDRSITTK